MTLFWDDEVIELGADPKNLEKLVIENLERPIIKYDSFGQIDGSIHPKDGSAFELALAATHGIFFFPIVYWKKEEDYFTVRTPEGWHHPFTFTPHTTIAHSGTVNEQISRQP